MTLEKLNEANRIANRLKKWEDIDNRLSLGSGFYRIIFKANITKSLPGEYEESIESAETIHAYHTFVKSMIKKCELQLENI